MITKEINENTFEPYYKIEYTLPVSLFDDIKMSYLVVGEVKSDDDIKKILIEIVLADLKSELENI